MLTKCSEQTPGDVESDLGLLISIEFLSEHRCDQTTLMADGELSRCTWAVTCCCIVIASVRG